MDFNYDSVETSNLLRRPKSNLDSKGNIVVDPASLITKDPFFIDYNLYKRFKLMCQKGKVAHKEMRITKEERE